MGAPLTDQQKAQVAAYYAGRNSWFPGEAVPKVNPYAGTDLAREWSRGLREVLAEERLNNCTEWDD